MATKVKICGLKCESDVDTAVEYGADMIGIAFFPPSPRNLTIAEGGRIADHARGRTRVVALTVDADDELIDRIRGSVGPDVWQLHGNESVARVREITQRSGLPAIKAIKVETSADAAEALAYADVTEQILFDAKAPKDSPLPGGNGLRFDWQVLDSVKDRLSYMLSGGLTPENVTTAIRLTGAPAVDVSSGVEARPGVKDPARIRAFLQAAKAL